MKTIEKVVISTNAPENCNVLWLDGTTLKACLNGQWEPLTGNVNKEIIELTVGVTDDIKELNLKVLGNKEHISYAKINGGYGFGSVYWTMPPGGTVFSGLLCSVNPAGSTIWYNINSDGAISKITESYDLYKYYCEKKAEANEEPLSNEDFMDEVLSILM